MTRDEPIVRWQDGDILIDVLPDRNARPWCVTLEVSHAVTRQSAKFEWNAQTVHGLAAAPPDRLSRDPGRPLLITHNRGLGDFIQQCRYLRSPDLAGRQILLEVPPPLRTFVARQDFAVEVVDQGSRQGDPALDEAASIRLDEWLADPAGARPYLVAKKRPPRSGRRLRVGLNWHGLPGTLGADAKSVPLLDLRALVEPRGDIDWVSLQWGETERELDRFPWASVIEPRGGGIDTIDRLAEEIADLDLFLSIDSAPAHLAGALGAPVWMLLSRACGWRWRLRRATCLLYGSMTMFRQTPGNGWAELIARLSMAIDRHSDRPGSVATSLALGGEAVPEDVVVARLSDDPIGTCLSYGLDVGAQDARGLALVFQLLVRCFGGYSWCMTEPDPQPILPRWPDFDGNGALSRLVAALGIEEAGVPLDGGDVAGRGARS